MNNGDRVERSSEMIPQRVNELLLEKGLNRAWLSRQTNIPDSTLSNYLNKDRVIPPSHVKVIADALGVWIDDLIRGTRTKAPPAPGKVASWLAIIDWLEARGHTPESLRTFIEAAEAGFEALRKRKPNPEP